MPYAEGRIYYDADSHLMETQDWMLKYADPGIRAELRPLYLGGAGKLVEDAIARIEGRRNSAEAVSLAEERLMQNKGWLALGATDPSERKRALDLLGFHKQLVFSTFAPTHFEGMENKIVYGGVLAHNRAISDFCANDKRLIAVGYVPLYDPEMALNSVNQALKLGCGAILVPSYPPKGKSPSHPDYFPIWERLQEAHVPFMLHVGGGGNPLNRSFNNNGKPPTTDFIGGGENIRSKDYMVLHNPPETFLSVMVLDGIFERFPRLKAGCIEQGAMWVVPWLKRLDLCQQMFAKTEPALKEMPMPASDYVRRQVWFTPFPTEPVGWMIENAGEELFLFSSDYPHPEGGRDPLKRFEGSMIGINQAAKTRFYSENFAEMMSLHR
jgi:predicted TIM-barrel fold metal-dependent hydrolase